MEIQQIMFGGQKGDYEVVIRFMGHDRSLWEGPEKECREFIRVCQINKAGD